VGARRGERQKGEAGGRQQRGGPHWRRDGASGTDRRSCALERADRKTTTALTPDLRLTYLAKRAGRALQHFSRRQAVRARRYRQEWARKTGRPDKRAQTGEGDGRHSAGDDDRCPS